MTFSRRSRRAVHGGAADQPAESPDAPGADIGFRPIEPLAGTSSPVTAGEHAPVRPSLTDADISPLVLSRKEKAPSGAIVWLSALVVAGLWAAAPIAFALGYRSNIAPFGDERFALAVLALLSIGPAALVFVAAYILRQGQVLAYEARRTKAMAEDMLAPAVVAAARTGQVAQAVRDEIALASVAAQEARDTLLALRDALAFETDKLTGAADQSTRAAQELTQAMGRERSEMGSLAQMLDAQALRVADAVSAQARMVTEATSVAETQIRDAEAVLTARAADLAAAAGEASTAARTAGEDLTRHITRLETAGVGVSEQVRAVEGGLSEQRTALMTLSQALRVDHGAFSQHAEAHAEKLAEFIDQARLAAVEMNDRATAGGEALRQLMADAVLQFRDLAETARAEREEFGQSTVQSLEAVSAAAAAQRGELEAQTRAAIEALEAAAAGTRAAAGQHAAAARDQVDQLSEAAFNAGQQANKVFEARLEEARALVAQSSRMVEEAGAATAHKLDEGAAAARATLEELGAMMRALEERARQIPANARVQAEQVRTAVADGMDELMAQARRTAEEAQAIDAAFQERVRRNFEMLSEAVKLMGAMTAAPQQLSASETSSPRSHLAGVSPPIPTQGAPAAAPGAELADRIGLRHRLRLEPTATDREFSQVFAAAGGPPAALRGAPSGDEPDAWSWKDLLASLEDGDGGDDIESVLAEALRAMSVDPAGLLPESRVGEAAVILQAGDIDGAREVTRKLAPAATRRIARRLFTDDVLKARATAYIGRYRALVRDVSGRDPTGGALADLLATEGGRIFLLFDAAGGDMI